MADCRCLREAEGSLPRLLKPWLKANTLQLLWKTEMITHKTKLIIHTVLLKSLAVPLIKPIHIFDISYFFRIICYLLIPTVAWVFILTNLASIITFWILCGITSLSSWYWNLTIEHNLNFSSLATPFVLINTPRDKGHLKKCRTPSTMHSWTGIQSS